MNLKEEIKSQIKDFRYLLEAIIVKLGLWFFGRINIEKAANIAAILSKFIGKKISVQKLAYNNLSRAIPELSTQNKDKILDDMWDNLGRIIGEFPHIAKYSADELLQFVEMTEETKRNIEKIKASGKGGIIVSGHIGNWEIGPKCLIAHGLEAATVYRPLNNPYVEEMTAKLRGVDLIEKSTSGSRKIIEVIKNGGFVVILADQKISEGEPVRFFHDDAITTTSIARIALKYDVMLIPARSIRLGKQFKFRVEVEKPLEIEGSHDINSAILQLTREINRKLESWIKEYPAQWFWVHDRWKDKKRA